jgi:hypothetical protein
LGYSFGAVGDEMKYLWLIILLVGLSLLVILSLYSPQESQKHISENSQAQVKYLLGQEPGSLSKLFITDDATQVQISKIDNVWFYESLEGALIELSENFSRQLSILRIAKIEREFFVTKEALSDYGISSESIKILLTFSDIEKQQKFLIGAVSPDGFGQYLYHEHEKRIIIIPAFQVTNILDMRTSAAQ